MKAIAIAEPGAEPAMCELPLPIPADDEILLRVHTSSINGFDLSVARGNLMGVMEHRFPVVLGKDVAGTVQAIGAAVEGVVTGDEMFGVVIKPYLGDGGLCEFVAAPAGFLAKRPAEVNVKVAGALGLAGTAAADAVRAIGATPGDTVLVAGATGGVGAIALQILKSRGATVIATAANEEERAFVANLGADIVVDYLGDLRSGLQGIGLDDVDAALHLAGDGRSLSSLLRSGGRLASTLGIGAEGSGRDDITVTQVMANPVTETLAWLADEVVAGRLSIPFQREYQLADAPQAMRDFVTGTLGKLVINVA